MNCRDKRAWFKKYDKERHDLRERLGLCVVCGGPRDEDGSGIKSSLRTCLRCRTLRRGYSRNYYRTHSIVMGPGPVAINRHKTHCIRGHKLPEPKNGHRCCIPCKNLRKRLRAKREPDIIRIDNAEPVQLCCGAAETPDVERPSTFELTGTRDDISSGYNNDLY